jgi:hypothetical protein
MENAGAIRPRRTRPLGISLFLDRSRISYVPPETIVLVGLRLPSTATAVRSFLPAGCSPTLSTGTWEPRPEMDCSGRPED